MLQLSCILFLIIQFTETTLTQNAAADWNSVDSQRQQVAYWLSDFAATQQEAMQHCAERNSTLASILTATQDMELRFFLDLNDGTGIITSGHNDGTEWKWTSAPEPFPMTYFNWRQGQPFGRNNNCMGVQGLSVMYGWFATPCTNALKFVCQKRQIVRKIAVP